MFVRSSSAARAKVLAGPYKDHIYNTVIRAIIESSLVVWMGLLTYAIAETRVLSPLKSGRAKIPDLETSVSSLYAQCLLRGFLMMLTGVYDKRIYIHVPSVHICG
jgi:hypothetical protein